MEIVTLTHKHTYSYLVKGSQQWLMFDAGWPDSFVPFARSMKEQGVRIKDIQHFVVSHFHMDHAGLTQVLKDYGVGFLLHECQVGATGAMNDFFTKHPDADYRPITETNNQLVTSAESRELLKQMGIDGEIIHTPGHSPDSVTLIIDNLFAFVGDLPGIELASGFGSVEMEDSWLKILSYGVKTVYPAHADIYHV
ncbi:MAG: MBL fold metallo-hydrolase [Coriobacteriales bacterium]|jgi:glyoxylase-like metal-dependent hydrolase (beta-lactamase superfamily II)|nr:MBL fold metallo-hydrolase [Coriobacteriales bacterium]